MRIPETVSLHGIKICLQYLFAEWLNLCYKCVRDELHFRKYYKLFFWFLLLKSIKLVQDIFLTLPNPIKLWHIMKVLSAP